MIQILCFATATRLFTKNAFEENDLQWAVRPSSTSYNPLTALDIAQPKPAGRIRVRPHPSNRGPGQDKHDTKHTMLEAVVYSCYRLGVPSFIPFQSALIPLVDQDYLDKSLDSPLSRLYCLPRRVLSRHWFLPRDLVQLSIRFDLANS